MTLQEKVDRLEELRRQLEGCESLEDAVDLLAEFRTYTLAAHLIMWATIALVFAPLADRVLAADYRVPRAAASTQSPQ